MILPSCLEEIIMANEYPGTFLVDVESFAKLEKENAELKRQLALKNDTTEGVPIPKEPGEYIYSDSFLIDFVHTFKGTELAVFVDGDFYLCSLDQFPFKGGYWRKIEPVKDPFITKEHCKQFVDGVFDNKLDTFIKSLSHDERRSLYKKYREYLDILKWCDKSCEEKV